MSRIGKLPVSLPAGVTMELKDKQIFIKGPKGTLALKTHPLITVEANDEQITVKRNIDSKEARSLHGLYRSLLSNMSQGVVKGYEKRLEIEGVGYKFQVQGKKLVLNLGFSHPIDFPIPPDIEIGQDPEKKNLIIIKGIDKQRVGQIAANIRELKKPEPYKGKGIRYQDEKIKRKAGKAAAKEK